MKPSDFQKTVQCRFESCLKKVVRHVVKDYQQKLKRRQEKETLFCELPKIVVENLAVWDDYETDYTIFNVCGYDIRVYDDELAEALRKLQSAQPQRSTEKIPSIRFVCFWFSAFQRNAQPLPPAMISGVWGYVTNKH